MVLAIPFFILSIPALCFAFLLDKLEYTDHCQLSLDDIYDTTSVEVGKFTIERLDAPLGVEYTISDDKNNFGFEDKESIAELEKMIEDFLYKDKK